MSTSLQVLAEKENRDTLLLAEVAAWLHDVGKFCDLHIEVGSIGGTQNWSNNHAYKAVLDTPSQVIHLSQASNNLKKPDVLKGVLKATSPKAADFLPQSLKDALQQITITIKSETYTLAELVMLGTPGFATDKNRANLLDKKDGWLPAALGICHSEGHTDKQEPGKNEGQQQFPNVFISSAFGYESDIVVINDPIKGLTARIQAIPITPTMLSQTPWTAMEILKMMLLYGVGDTRRPINEITLADWSATVAALFKPVIAALLLTSQKPGIRQWKSWKDKTIDHDIRWRILRVNFDVLDLYAKAIKIADVLAYKKAVADACEAVKHLVEVDYPLGNEVYRDTTGIYFTYPDLALFPELKEQIRQQVEAVDLELAPRIDVTEGDDGTTAAEQLRDILGKAHGEALHALVQPFDSHNLSTCWQEQWETVGKGKWEVCPVCRLRPMQEGQDACGTCLSRRASRVETWLDDPQTTIWIDEIADANKRVALLVGRFGLDDWLSGDLVQTMLVRADPATNTFTPKNPSPARLRRAWETCQRFWTETTTEILKNVSPGSRQIVIPDERTGWQENLPYDGTVNGKAISLLWREQAQHFVTISNLQWVDDTIEENQEIVVSEPDAPAHTRRFKVQGVMPAMGDMVEYNPMLTLLESPDQFMALLPAADALEIAEQIHAAYVEQFGKVQNRLPLFLGLVFFPRKTPLMATMDAARRMLEAPLQEEQWTLAQDVVNGQVTFTNGNQWTVPVVMGDGSTPDEWYPYFFVTDTVDAGTRERHFQLGKVGETDPSKVGAVSDKYADRRLVYVSDLKKDDVVMVTPSHFAYLFLEHTAQRFRFAPEQDVQYLDELARLKKMWDTLRDTPDMSDSKLQAIWALFRSKWALWGLDDKGAADYDARQVAFKQLVETTFGRDKVTDITPEDVVNGTFDRCLELYHHILKKRVKQEAYND